MPSHRANLTKISRPQSSIFLTEQLIQDRNKKSLQKSLFIQLCSILWSLQPVILNNWRKNKPNQTKNLPWQMRWDKKKIKSIQTPKNREKLTGEFLNECAHFLWFERKRRAALIAEDRKQTEKGVCDRSVIRVGSIMSCLMIMCSKCWSILSGSWPLSKHTHGMKSTLCFSNTRKDFFIYLFFLVGLF